ncbi:DUF5958 family protein [Streptomyces sp. ID05-39B]|nr:DUF5958 family protein [Streptomyces sp. ID05-39B]
MAGAERARASHAGGRRGCRRLGTEALPAYELTKSFRLLVALFTIADTRRRTLYCAGGCGHAWHNLPDPRQCG